MRTPVLTALSSQTPSDAITVCGWVRTRRDAKAFSFIEINDGSCLRGIQVVIDAGGPGSEDLPHLTRGASVEVSGRLVASHGDKQAWEIQATSVKRGGLQTRRIPCKKRGTPWSFCGRLPTCGRGRSFLELLSRCAAGWPTRCIISSRNVV